MGLFASDNPVLFISRPEMVDFETGRNMREFTLRNGFRNAKLLIHLRAITC